MSGRAEEAALEGFLDVIKKIHEDITRPKKNNPDSWKRAYLSIYGLIKTLRVTYANPTWVEKQGAIQTPFINMSDQASHLLVNGAIPEDLSEALEQHLHTTQTVLQHWEHACNERGDILENAFRQIGFDPQNVEAWPYYSNKLTAMLHNLKPIKFINVYHDFDGLMGTIVVMPDGDLSIGHHVVQSPKFPPLETSVIPNVAQSVINLLTYYIKFPEMGFVPARAYVRVEVYNGQFDADGDPAWDYESFMDYVWEHNELLGRLLDGDHNASDMFADGEVDNIPWKFAPGSPADFRDSSQPYRELKAAMLDLCFAVEYWLYRSLR